MYFAQRDFPQTFVACVAKSGRDAGQLLVNETNWVAQQVPNTSQKILVYMAGVNDIDPSHSRTLGQYTNDVITSVGLARANGYTKIIGCSLMSFNGETNGSFTRAQANNFITNYAGWDAFCDYAAVPSLGTNGAWQNSVFFEQAIGKHPTGPGSLLMWQTLQPVIASMLRSTNQFGNFTGNGSGLTGVKVADTNITGTITVTNGNVGIGTTSPSGILDVRGTNHATFRYNPTGTAYFGINQQDGNGTTVGDNYNFTAFGAATSLYSGTLAEYMRIAPGGNVGIGTTNPVAKLDVNGNVHITGNTTNSGTVTASGFAVGTTNGISNVEYIQTNVVGPHGIIHTNYGGILTGIGTY